MNTKPGLFEFYNHGFDFYNNPKSKKSVSENCMDVC